MNILPTWSSSPNRHPLRWGVFYCVERTWAQIIKNSEDAIRDPFLFGLLMWMPHQIFYFSCPYSLRRYGKNKSIWGMTNKGSPPTDKNTLSTRSSLALRSFLLCRTNVSTDYKKLQRRNQGSISIRLINIDALSNLLFFLSVLLASIREK